MAGTMSGGERETPAARNGLGVGLDARGLHLEALGLWLDPVRAAPAAYLSHAHAALAAAGSGHVYATRETLALAEALGVTFARATPVEPEQAFELAAPGPTGGRSRLSVAPAGHVLGASQLVVDHPGGRFVYTGDWSDVDDGTHAPGVCVACDELIVTSTFGLPIFRFDGYAPTLAALVAWCAASLADGHTPTVLAQSPGPAQAIARALGSRGLAVTTPPNLARVCRAYEALGVPMPVLTTEEAGAAKEAVVLASADSRPVDRPSRGARSRSRRTAYASGWAVLDAAVDQKRADAAFPLADHADHDALVRLVHASGAGRVHVTRGDSRVLSHMLARRGVDARSIDLPAIDSRSSA